MSWGWWAGVGGAGDAGCSVTAGEGTRRARRRHERAVRKWAGFCQQAQPTSPRVPPSPLQRARLHAHGYVYDYAIRQPPRIHTARRRTRENRTSKHPQSLDCPAPLSLRPSSCARDDHDDKCASELLDERSLVPSHPPHPVPTPRAQVPLTETTAHLPRPLPQPRTRRRHTRHGLRAREPARTRHEVSRHDNRTFATRSTFLTPSTPVTSPPAQSRPVKYVYDP